MELICISQTIIFTLNKLRKKKYLCIAKVIYFYGNIRLTIVCEITQRGA